MEKTGLVITYKEDFKYRLYEIPEVNSRARDVELGLKRSRENKACLERVQPTTTTYHMERALWPEVKYLKYFQFWWGFFVFSSQNIEQHFKKIHLPTRMLHGIKQQFNIWI